MMAGARSAEEGEIGDGKDLHHLAAGMRRAARGGVAAGGGAARRRGATRAFLAKLWTKTAAAQRMLWHLPAAGGLHKRHCDVA